MRPILIELWLIIQPIVQLLVLTVSPIIVAWIVVRVRGFLNIADKNQALEFEARLRAAIHESAMNALKFAATKAGTTLDAGTALSANTPMIREAINYVRTKNPDAVDAFQLNDKALSEIILSKVPDLIALTDKTKKSAR